MGAIVTPVEEPTNPDAALPLPLPLPTQRTTRAGVARAGETDAIVLARAKKAAAKKVTPRKTKK